jgi:hypothetical protein
MSDIAKFIWARHIDSFQKLHLLIFLHQHPESSWTSQQMAERLYLGDAPLLEEMITELQAADLIECAANRCKIRDEASIRESLQRLANTYENPLARQKILGGVRHRVFVPSRYQERAHETR